MGHVPLLFSLLFFTSSAVYLFFGIYIINMNLKASLNKLFLIVCCSLCLWSFGFSIANSAANMETCLFWRRISAIGWASIYSLLLHFLLLLTSEKCTLKRWRFCLLLYLPAVINMYVFSISKEMTAIQYNLVKMDYGWVNIAVNNGWDLFFYIYYAGYVLACLAIVWRWKRKSSDESARKQANLIFISILAALLLGSLTDVVLSSSLTSPLPQMAPIFTLIPIAAIHYSIKRYSLMREVIENKDELILNNETRAKLHYYLSIAFLTGGLLTLLSRFLPHLINGEENFKSTLYASGLLFIFGFAILIFRLIKAENIKNVLIMIITLSSIPIITLRFVEYASITVWAFPIILTIVSLVFNTRTPLILVTAMAIITQIIVWIYAPAGAIQMDKFDYILRIGIFVIAFWIGSVVNNIYLKRLKENIYQIDFQKMISEISFDFVSVNQASIDEKINNMLNKMGRFFYVDRTYVFLINHQDSTMAYTHEWCNEGIEPEVGTIQDIPLDVFPWWMEQLKSNKLVYIEDVSKLPDEAGAEKAQLTRQDIKSIVAIPIEGNGELLGYIGFDSVASFRKWSNYHIKLLKILANLLADGLIKTKAEKEIELMAYYDHLTGLPNRTLFWDRLNQAIHLAKRTERFVGVMFMDLDGFKMVNDTMGHSGGDEFLIMINNIPDAKDIVKIADSIMKLFEKPFNLNEQEFFITGSAGVAVYPVDGEDAGTLIKNADIAMYRAKSKGKSQYALCTEDMKEEVKKNMILSNSLYRAQERNELVVYYQPQVRLHTGQVIGIEALLRWKHPEMGMIFPSVFIPLAEKNGLINSIGEWVLRTASSQNKKWQDMGLPHLRMAVNLSISQFNNPRIVDNVDSILKETGLSPEYLELEITESIAIKEANYTIGILNKLKKLGVSISIDDFGTEYSSLSRLKILPIDRIKIDMQFVQGIEGNEKDQAITKIIINLAKSLGLEVLAEGVETAPQLEFLNQKMCDDVQGYYYYKPMPAEEIEKLLKSNASKKAE
ncbi:MAG TPA: bifunctional diguanylate cyclase/phosphodiesterase [Ruminiclostridium sp.]|nr:bifunctional diguanylate cyclase/phosphodiesterase [Ruminiclostridium sp.]